MGTEATTNLLEKATAVQPAFTDLTAGDVLTSLRDTADMDGSIILSGIHTKVLLDYVGRLEAQVADLHAETIFDPETFRREVPVLDATPVHGLLVDYGSAGTSIDKAMGHLNEGLPGGQKRRCETAYALLNKGAQELGVWMRAKGYRV